MTSKDPSRTGSDASGSLGADTEPDAALAKTAESLERGDTVASAEQADTLASGDPIASEATLESPGSATGAEKLLGTTSGSLELERGQKLDHFVILDRLGAGGMGVVVEAYDPSLDRRVAIKVLRPDVGEGGSRERPKQRLLREAQAMAKLSHPNVVTVHEVGTVGDRVFVAMEYVRGKTLSQWLAVEPRSWRQVLDVFREAGAGLAAAHEAGMVHRDFKPDNVLIGEDGRVCVTDFGLVSSSGAAVESGDDGANEGEDTEKAISLSVSLTRTGTLLGTPMYMAPEQHARKPVDERADQFAFCVALYEALYGERPFEGKSYWDLASSVTSGQVKAPPARAQVPAWVRTVVLRGLRVEPDDRFPSMAALLGELAKDPEAARRRRLRIAGTSLAFVLLSAAAVYGVLRSDGRGPAVCRDAKAQLDGIWDAQKKRQVEQAFAATGLPYAAATFERAAAVLDEYTEAWVAMRTSACEATHVHGTQSAALLDLRMHCLDRLRAHMTAVVEILISDPDAEVVDKAVQATRELPGVDVCADVDALTTAVPPPSDPEERARIDAIAERLAEAQALGAAGRYNDGLKVATGSLADARAADHAPILADALYVVGSLENRAGDAEAAEKTFEEAVQIAAEARNDRLVAQIWSKLVYVVGTKQARYDDALVLRRTAEAAVARAGDEPELRADLENNLGSLFWAKAEFREAQEHYEQAVALWTEVRGESHPDVANALNNLGAALGEQGKYLESKEHFTRALEVRESALGPSHPYVATTLNNLAGTLFALGDYAEALRLHERALAIKEAAFGPEHPRVAQSLNNIGNVYLAQHRLPEARDYLQRALAIWEKLLGSDHPNVAQALHNLGAVALAEGDHAEARELHLRGLGIMEKRFGADDPAVAWSLDNVGRVLLAEGKTEEAIASYQRALSMFEKALGPDHPDTAYALAGLGECYLHKGEPEPATAHLERALAIRTRSAGSPADLAQVRFLLARALWAGERGRDRAVGLARKALKGYSGVGAGSATARAEVEKWLAAHSNAELPEP